MQVGLPFTFGISFGIPFGISFGIPFGISFEDVLAARARRTQATTGCR